MTGGRTGTVAWVNGRLVDAARPAIPVTDRGFQLGDGVFETLRVRRAVPIEWAEHHERLRAGADALGFRLPAETSLLDGLRVLLDALGLAAAPEDDRSAEAAAVGDASVRITVSRGALASRGTLPAGWHETQPTVVIQAWPFAAPPGELLERGAAVVTSRVRVDPASPLAGIKTTSRAESVFARLEADRAGADDALFLTDDGDVAEATSANVFAVREGRLVTPPLDAGILPGTTRTWLLDGAGGELARLALVAAAEAIRPTQLVASDEAFLSSSVAGIVPLVAVDGRSIGRGRPGRVTVALRAARERWIDEQSRMEFAVAKGVDGAQTR